MKGGIEDVDQWAKKGHRRGKRWLFRVWDAHHRRWKSKAFADDNKRAGWTWAEDQRSRLNLGLAATGTLPFSAIAEDYVTTMRQRGLGEVNILEVERITAAVIAAGATDLHSDTFAKTVRTWLASATSFAKGRTMALSPITKNRWLRHLKAVAESAVGKRYGLHANPLKDLKGTKEDKALQPTLRLDELRALVIGDVHPADPHYLAGCFMVYAGMRVGEAHHVRWEWIDLGARTIHVRVIRDARGLLVWAPKGNKERIIPLQRELAEILDAWPWRQATGWAHEADEFRAMDASGHWMTFRRYLVRCGLAARDLHPHCTRHTWAAMMLATGASPTLVRRAMGHVSLVTTDGYANAESAYTTAVRGWPRGELCLRRAPTALPPDPLAFLREHVQAGGRLVDLAGAAGVPVATCEAWLREGLPESARQYAALLAARRA